MSRSTTIRTDTTGSPMVGGIYRVIGYHTGDFVGQCLAIDMDVACFRVTDPCRSIVNFSDRCPFPGCVLREQHEGEHNTSFVRLGGLVDVNWRLAKFKREDLGAALKQLF